MPAAMRLTTSGRGAATPVGVIDGINISAAINHITSGRLVPLSKGTRLTRDASAGVAKRLARPIIDPYQMTKTFDGVAARMARPAPGRGVYTTPFGHFARQKAPAPGTASLPGLLRSGTNLGEILRGSLVQTRPLVWAPPPDLARRPSRAHAIYRAAGMRA